VAVIVQIAAATDGFPESGLETTLYALDDNGDLYAGWWSGDHTARTFKWTPLPRPTE
jgi:hypothetical protein